MGEQGTGAWRDTDPPQPPAPGKGSVPTAGRCEPQTPWFPAHRGTASLAGSAELVLNIVSTTLIILFLSCFLGAVLACMYIRKSVRPPAVLVRQPGTQAPFVLAWAVIRSRDKVRLTLLFPLPHRRIS